MALALKTKLAPSGLMRRAAVATAVTGAAVVVAASHPSIQLLTDIYHMLREDEPANQISKFAASIRHAHIAEKATRTVPGRAGDDFTAYFAALHAMDYQGAMAIEAHYGADLHADVVLGLATLRQQWGN